MGAGGLIERIKVGIRITDTAPKPKACSVCQNGHYALTSPRMNIVYKTQEEIKFFIL